MVLEFFLATRTEQAIVIKEFGFPIKDTTMYVAKNNGKIVGFASFSGETLRKIELVKNFRKGNNAKIFFDFVVKDYLKRNKSLAGIYLNAGNKRQLAIERWYSMLGGVQHPKEKNIFFFLKPKKKESFLNARKRILNSRKK